MFWFGFFCGSFFILGIVILNLLQGPPSNNQQSVPMSQPTQMVQNQTLGQVRVDLESYCFFNLTYINTAIKYQSGYKG